MNKEAYFLGRKIASEKLAAIVDMSKLSKIPPHALMDLAGLGILAAPSAYELGTDKEMNPKLKAIAELAGLGTLGASVLKHLKVI